MTDVDWSLSEPSFPELLGQIAAKTPTPGGGAVAAAVAGLAAALGGMVVSYSVGSKKLADHHEANEASMERLQAMASKTLELADADAAAYAELNDLFRLDEDNPERVARWDGAVERAIAAPERLLRLAIEMLEALEALAPRSNRMLRSDLGMAAVLAEAAARSAAWNVRINLPLMTDEDAATERGAITDAREADARAAAARIEAACRG